MPACSSEKGEESFCEALDASMLCNPISLEATTRKSNNSIIVRFSLALGVVRIAFTTDHFLLSEELKLFPVISFCWW